MSYVTDESNGPDPTRGNPKCTEFHDGTIVPIDQGGLYNCCCCDPCRYIRPNGVVGGRLPVWDADSTANYCCKCVPRVLFLVFVPDDADDACCQSVGRALFVQKPEGDTSYYNFYEGELFDVTVRVEVGRVLDSDEYGAIDDCGWKITTTVQPDGYGTSDTQEWEIDHDDVTCLYLPDGIELATVEGPAGCTGTLMLYDVEKAKVPFEQREDITPYEGNFLALGYDDSCGECVELPTVLCATGMRHAGDTVVERREFVWFEDAGIRGWAYDNPVTGKTERLLLSDEYSGCVITPDLEDGAEIFDPVALEPPCSCQMHVVFVTSVNGTPYAFSLRAGWCSCWEFACAKCRCVPLELCVMYWDGSAMHANVFVEWNEATNSWDAADRDQFRLVLQENSKYQCEIHPWINGEEVSMDSYPVWDCGDETASGEFSGKHDILSVNGSGSIDGIYGGTDYVWFSASSLMPSCWKAPCNICTNECGSSPASLTVSVTQWTEYGDASGIEDYQECNWEFTVHFVQEINGFDATGPDYNCYYVGFLFCGGYDRLIKVEVHSNQISFAEIPAWQVGDPSPCVIGPSIDWSPSCDPVYWDSGDLSDSPDWISSMFSKTVCGDCDPETIEDTYHLQIVVTE